MVSIKINDTEDAIESNNSAQDWMDSLQILPYNQRKANTIFFKLFYKAYKPILQI